jgi:hypothetical protein
MHDCDTIPTLQASPNDFDDVELPDDNEGFDGDDDEFDEDLDEDLDEDFGLDE